MRRWSCLYDVGRCVCVMVIGSGLVFYHLVCGYEFTSLLHSILLCLSLFVWTLISSCIV